MNVLCVTSDKYLHCMGAFAYCFNKYWSDEQTVGVLCYDVPHGLPSNFVTVSLGKMEWFTWAGALHRFLDFTGWDQFVMLLDDYFLTEPVKLDLVHDLYEEMEARPTLGKIDLTNDRTLFAREDTPHKGIIRAVWKDSQGKRLYNEGGFKSRLWLTSLQSAIWRTDFIRDWINPEWNPWEVEREGSKALAMSDSTWQIWGTWEHPVKYANMCKSGKPMMWRLEKGMDKYPELWAELQKERLV